MVMVWVFAERPKSKQAGTKPKLSTQALNEFNAQRKVRTIGGAVRRIDKMEIGDGEVELTGAATTLCSAVRGG